jgi:DNA primase
MIPQSNIQTIIDTARIEEVVGDFVHLKKRGVNLLGLCPFHNEKTPSFTVSPAKGIYKCFGCGAAGSSVGFIMEHEHLSYPEALKYLARKYQIEVEEEEQSAEQIAQYNERESMLQTVDFASKFFVEQLWETNKGKSIGLNYLTERGISTEMIRKFQLGYSPDEWTALTDHALKNAHDIKLLEKTGLTILRENDQKFDRFKGRVMFPIHNLSGQVIGFGGRTLSTDKKQAKYLNSPESDLYHKSKVLYGISFARNEMVRADNCFLVEGYTDVISLFDSGIENVVASSGTALTADQIKLIKRFTNNITVLYDGDFAGIKAGLRGVDMILAEGMNVRVVLFPEGEDPDSFARSHRSSEVKEYVTGQAQDFISFKTSLLSDEAQNDPIKRAGLIKEIVQSISVIPDAITRQVYVRECSTLLEMPEQTLMNELNKLLHKKFKDETYSTKKQQSTSTSATLVKPKSEENTLRSRLSFQEENLSRLLLKYGHMDFEIKRKNQEPIEVNVAAYIIDQMELDNLQFENQIYHAIYQEFEKSLETEIFQPHSYFINHENSEVARFSVDQLMDKYDLSPNWMEAKNIYVKSEERDHLSMSVQNSIFSYKLSVLERDIQELSQVLKDTKDDEELEKTLLTISKKESQKKFLSDELGRIVLR